MTKPTQLVEIEKPIYGGAFLARVEGKALFTPFCLPGEQARVRRVEEKRSFAMCELEEIVQASPQRIEPRCRHFGICGGCNYQHTDGVTQLRMKIEILKETLERAGVAAPKEIDVLSGEPWEYRNRIRLAVDGSGRMGYRTRRSRQIVPIAECPIAAPVLLRAAEAAEQVLLKLPQIGVAEIEFFANPTGSELLASVLASAPQKAAQWAVAFAAGVPGLTGMELLRMAPSPGQSGTRQSRTRQSGKRQSEIPKGPNESVAHWGNHSLKYMAAGFEYRVDVGAFFQVNRFLVDALAKCVTAEAAGNVAWDLYAGVGLFARQLAARFKQVIAVESAPASTEALTQNLAGICGTTVRARTEDFLRHQVSGGKNKAASNFIVPDLMIPDLIIMDPPRAGLGAETVELLTSIGAPRMVYVSCDPATLARDLKGLTGAGYRIRSLTMADLFPQTYHLESIVHLERG